MMNQTNGWMSGWTGGGMWIWAVIGLAVVVLLAVVIARLSRK
jgi:anti-sigma-K factor RskA